MANPVASLRTAWASGLAALEAASSGFWKAHPAVTETAAAASPARNRLRRDKGVGNTSMGRSWFSLGRTSS